MPNTAAPLKYIMGAVGARARWIHHATHASAPVEANVVLVEAPKHNIESSEFAPSSSDTIILIVLLILIIILITIPIPIPVPTFPFRAVVAS